MDGITAEWLVCESCGDTYRLGERELDSGYCPTCESFGDEPDFAGAFDGFTVTSDADPGL